MRDTISYPNVELPIIEAQEVSVTVDGVKGSLYVIPNNGQLLVQGTNFAKLISAKTDYYSKSRILVVSKNKNELIVRAGSNAAYENKQKTPMPLEAMYIEKSVYVPLSVIGNSFGYRISWNQTEMSLVLESL